MDRAEIRCDANCPIPAAIAARRVGEDAYGARAAGVVMPPAETGTAGTTGRPRRAVRHVEHGIRSAHAGPRSCIDGAVLSCPSAIQLSANFVRARRAPRSAGSQRSGPFFGESQLTQEVRARASRALFTRACALQLDGRRPTDIPGWQLTTRKPGGPPCKSTRHHVVSRPVAHRTVRSPDSRKNARHNARALARFVGDPPRRRPVLPRKCARKRRRDASPQPCRDEASTKSQ